MRGKQIVDFSPTVWNMFSGTHNNVTLAYDSVTKRITISSTASDSGKERRFDATQNPTFYHGKAPYGSVDTDAVWTITKLVINSNSTITKTTATNVSWNNRLTATYS